MAMAIAENGGGRRFGAWRLILWGGAGLLLAAPLIAMQFTAEVDWTAFDFAVFGAMLAVACGAVELTVRRTHNIAYRVGAALAVATAFALAWVTLAVGFIGDEGERANLLPAGVLAVALLGGLLARFRPLGMTYAMLATAAAQALAAIVALVAGWDSPILASVVFTGLWLVCAILFRTAAR
jgi:hypothetical protein